MPVLRFGVVRTSAALLAALMLAACSSSAPAGKATTSSSAVPATTSSAPAPSVTPDDSAALRQWGSLVAGIEAPVRKAAAALSGCSAADYGPGSPAACSFGPLTLDLTVQTFLINLQIGQRRLGAPPAELAQLVTDTKAAGAALHTAQGGVQTGCTVTSSTACTRALMDFYQAKDDLTGSLDAWRPYTS